MTDHISDDETRVNLKKEMKRLKDKCPNQANMIILAGHFYHIITRNENELPLVHELVESVPEGYEFVIPVTPCVGSIMVGVIRENDT